MGGNARYSSFDLHRIDSRFRLDGFLLYGGPWAGLFAAHAVLREQPDAPRSRSRRRLQQEVVVARPVPIDRLGRELAQKPSLARGVRASRPPLVSDRHRLVFHLDARGRRPGSLRQAPPRFLAPARRPATPALHYNLRESPLPPTIPSH